MVTGQNINTKIDTELKTGRFLLRIEESRRLVSNKHTRAKRKKSRRRKASDKRDEQCPADMYLKTFDSRSQQDKD